MCKKIIVPDGYEITMYLLDGYKICNKCGAIMNGQNNEGDIVLICPSTRWTISNIDYSYENDICYEDSDDDVPPIGCQSCGGPYPYCKTSCKLFDN